MFLVVYFFHILKTERCCWWEGIKVLCMYYWCLSAQSGDLNDPGIPIKRYRWQLKVCVEPFWFRKRSKDSIVYSDLRNIRYKFFFMNIKKVIQQKKTPWKTGPNGLNEIWLYVWGLSQCKSPRSQRFGLYVWFQQLLELNLIDFRLVLRQFLQAKLPRH